MFWGIFPTQTLGLVYNVINACGPLTESSLGGGPVQQLGTSPGRTLTLHLSPERFFLLICHHRPNPVHLNQSRVTA